MKEFIALMKKAIVISEVKDKSDGFISAIGKWCDITVLDTLTNYLKKESSNILTVNFNEEVASLLNYADNCNNIELHKLRVLVALFIIKTERNPVIELMGIDIDYSIYLEQFNELPKEEHFVEIKELIFKNLISNSDLDEAEAAEIFADLERYKSNNF